MSRIIFLACLNCLLAFNAFSQAALQPGYIVLKNDTLRGRVQLIESKKGPLSCIFEKDGRRTTYTPPEIQTVSFNQILFIPAVLDSASVFAELIADGPAQLLHAGGIYHIRKGEQSVSLKPAERTVYVDDRAYAFEDRTFAGRLTLLLSDCRNQSALQRKIDKLHPARMQNIRIYTDLIETYNTCLNGTTKKVYVERKHWFSVGLQAGVTLPSATVNASSGQLVYGYTFKSSPRYTVSFLMNGATRNKRIDFQLEILFAKTKLDGQSPNPALRSYDIEYTTLGFPLSARYLFTKTSLAPYVRVGLSGQFLLGHVTNVPIYENGKYVGEYNLNIGRFGLRPFGGIGIEKKIKRGAMFIEGRYLPGTKLLGRSDEGEVRVNTLDVVIGVRL